VSQLQQNRYDQLLRRVGDLKGPGSKVSDALTELFPTIDVENVPGELLALMGTRIGFGSATVTSAAGETPRIQVFNPVGSGKLVTVTRVYITGQTIQVIRWAIATIALTTGVGTELFRDSRHPLTTRPTAQMRTDSTVAFTDAGGQFRLLANVPAYLEDTNGVAVLAPGAGFEVGNTSTASTLLVTFDWRERVAEPSELNF